MKKTYALGQLQKPELDALSDLFPSMRYDDYGNIRFELVGEYRAVKKGEFYLSGSEPAVYSVLGDVRGPYQIVRPVHVVTGKRTLIIEEKDTDLEKFKQPRKRYND